MNRNIFKRAKFVLYCTKPQHGFTRCYKVAYTIVKLNRHHSRNLKY